MERRFNRSTVRFSSAKRAKTRRPEQSQFWAAPVASVAGRERVRYGPGSEGAQENAASEKTTSGEGLHASRDDDLAGSAGRGRSGSVRHAGGCTRLHAELAGRIHRAAEG